MRQLRKSVNDFALWTQAGGLPNIGRAKSVSMRLFWGLVFAVCFSLCTYQTMVQVNKYRSYPFNVLTELQFESSPFPAVTICHMNPFRKTAVAANPNLTELIDGFSQAVRNQLSPDEDHWNFLKGNQTYMGKQTTARNSMLFDLASMSPTEKKRISYTRDELISSCTFNQKPCEGEFTATFYPTYGNCFTFNPDADLQTTRTGPAYGLRLLVLTDTTEYLPFTESAGVKIIATAKDERIFPDSSGYTAGTGFATSFTIQYLESTRLGPPYSVCTFLGGRNYSVEQCTRQCMQEYVYRKCRCSSPSMEAAEGTKYCTIKSTDCINEAVNLFRNPPNGTDSGASQCGCLQPCQELTYKLTSSTATWPSKPHETFDCPESARTAGRTCRDWYRKNALLVEIFYEHLNYQTMKESETYPFTSLISDFGGNMGLWIGFSIITLAELLFLPYMLLSKCVKGTRRDEAFKSLGGVEADYSDERDNEFDKVGGDHDPPPPVSGQPFELKKDETTRATANTIGKEKLPEPDSSLWIRTDKKPTKEAKYRVVREPVVDMKKEPIA